ncbi:uncharacterized protein LOC143592169 [Bidens hawaiensis]|uniref:uncharacterized protein LOC143592169 n=1 Tax=Bidens hawaiensis TaxID=980011 RepID=UPI00404B6FDC
MGNYTSACDCNCKLILSPRTKNTKSARVVFPSGEIRQFPDSAKAAEIMIECPTFFLVNSQSLSINRRFSPLSADEELESGNIYIMFLMRRLNLMVTPADMTVLWMAGNKRMVSPESEKPVEDKVQLMDAVAETAEFRHRMVVCRSRKPLLDTIAEETVFCR